MRAGNPVHEKLGRSCSIINFCQVFMGLDASTVCGHQPIGRCAACGLSVCRVHAAVTGSRVFCLNCQVIAEEPPPSGEIDASFVPVLDDPVDGLVSSEEPNNGAFERDEVFLTEEEGSGARE